MNEGDEPENFFWVGLGGKKDYDKVCVSLPKTLFSFRGTISLSRSFGGQDLLV